MQSSTAEMKRPVFTESQVNEFVDRGYVVLKDAFTKDAAAAVREWLLPRLGLREDDPSTWTEWLKVTRETLSGPLADACMTNRYFGALDQLMGEGAWNPPPPLGGWPVLCPGFASRPWTAPTEGWHIDGNWFQHHVDSPDQGILPIFIFSEIGPGDGGTAIRPGSHKIAARILAVAEPDGLSMTDLGVVMDTQTYPEVIECSGSAGDIIMMHPFMSHATSKNCGDHLRIISNPPVSLKKPHNLKRANPADYSPVERAIVEALAD